MLTNELFEVIRTGVLKNLEINLPKDLYYHSVAHTIDVEMQGERIAANEKSIDKEDLVLLKIGCLYHDTGFLFTYNEHEAAGCDLMVKELAAFGLTAKQIDIVNGLIMATKIPQKPLTKLEAIICDADLDYLGREDFFPISNNLFLELKARNLVTTENEWNIIQTSFFKQHSYFTNTTRKLREQQKQLHFEMINAVTTYPVGS
ncbi:MAG: HD domain-containing protein [Ferruginibacter sp.]